MTIISSDFAQLSTWRWRFYLSALLYIIKTITVVLRIVLWLRRIDRGISLYLYIKLLRWMYGPSMIPITAPPPTFAMYGLNMRSLKFRRVPIQVIFLLLRCPFLTPQGRCQRITAKLLA
ncbi:hypothetical protein OESDEN_04073 [Oesophagostomum dentatum]|uniref:Uncharacterized protein n=1 Tax=Oesophagostomum dentatum TaxID=61180 RepID=A0A0B1TIP0_OESDE|nr:hypothetical protein OESDEN_04073 [Oesophagostomum dentatum]